jgi:primary-amine oxidase
MNVHHLPRPEDWPLQPVVRAEFQFAPVGFFAQSPACVTTP